MKSLKFLKEYLYLDLFFLFFMFFMVKQSLSPP